MRSFSWSRCNTRLLNTRHTLLPLLLLTAEASRSLFVQKKGLMPEDPRGNVTITSITNELDSFKFRVLQGAMPPPYSTFRTSRVPYCHKQT